MDIDLYQIVRQFNLPGEQDHKITQKQTNKQINTIYKIITKHLRLQNTAMKFFQIGLQVAWSNKLQCGGLGGGLLVSVTKEKA